MKHKILLVDDEADILEFLEYNLHQEGYETATAENGREAIEIAKKFSPDLILMDVMMPEMDGIMACKEIRDIAQLKGVIIAFLTARSEDYTQIAGLDAGADDYINKPIKPRVLLSKVKALLRRKGQKNNDDTSQVDILTIGDITINKDEYTVSRGDNEVSLAKKEFELLHLLALKPGRVFRREEIMSRVWGEEVIVGDRTIDVHIRKLREKLGDNYIKTIKGIGYKIDV